MTSLVRVDVAFLSGLTRPTNVAELAINLDADQALLDPHAQPTPQTLPVDNITADFSRGLTVFDSLGSAQTVTLEFRHIVGPMAHSTSNAGVALQLTDTIAGGGGASGELAGINNGEALAITVGATTEAFEFVDTVGNGVIGGANEIVTVQDYVDAINAFGGGNILEGRLTPAGQVLIQAVDPTINFTMTNVAAGVGGDDPLTTPQPLTPLQTLLMVTLLMAQNTTSSQMLITLVLGILKGISLTSQTPDHPTRRDGGNFLLFTLMDRRFLKVCLTLKETEL